MSAETLNQLLRDKLPAFHRALSPLGLRAFYPLDIPFQAGQARGTTYNGTIGIFTDGHGGAVPLPSMDAVVNLPEGDHDRAFLYSPVAGIPEVRELWRDWQRRGQPADKPSTLPAVTIGLAHGLSLVADLFGGEGRVVAIPTPFWGNYRQTFTMRTGAEVRSAPMFRGGRFNPRMIADALEGLPTGEPAVAIVNFPSNPGGYSPTVDERAALKTSLLEIAEQRPLVVVCDDAYTGFVFEPEIPRESFFWELAGAHDALIPIKIDGATKEFSFFGGRVGFLTFGLELDDETWQAVHSKLQSLMRSTIGSPVALGQMILAQALRGDKAEAEVAEIFRLGEERYHAVRPALAEIDQSLLRPMPFNSGFFVLLELPEDATVGADAIRRHLIAEHDTGVVSISQRYLRLALCSVEAQALPELVRRVERGTREMLSR